MPLLLRQTEAFQKTGSFKARGASNAVVNLAPGIHDVVTHSSGNHAQVRNGVMLVMIDDDDICVVAMVMLTRPWRGLHRLKASGRILLWWVGIAIIILLLLLLLPQPSLPDHMLLQPLSSLIQPHRSREQQWSLMVLRSTFVSPH